MHPIRKIYQDAPDSIAIPEELRHQPVEIIIWPLSEPVEAVEQTNENGWPLAFFAATFGSIPDLPDREWARRLRRAGDYGMKCIRYPQGRSSAIRDAIHTMCLTDWEI